MKISRLVKIMILTVILGLSIPVIAAAQGGPPPGVDTVNCVGCVGTTDIANGAIVSLKIDASQVQNRVTGSCAIGSSIAKINQDGTVVCDTDQVGIAAVTASAPLISSGGSSPNISLPGVIIDNVNAAIGQGALFSNTTGIHNIASGAQALINNTTGSGNTAVGYQSLYFNTSSVGNTAIGYIAMVKNTTGSSNSASGYAALGENTTGQFNTASGASALLLNTTGQQNTAAGSRALLNNITGNSNTAVGYAADVASGDLTNATAIGAGAIVDASNKIRLGSIDVSVIEAQVGLTVVSDATKKENFRPVDGESVLERIQGLNLTSWNLIGQDPKQFRHYGPIAQEFFAAFGTDGVGTIGNPTTITSTDMDGILMVAAQALGNRTAQQTEDVSRLKAENATLKARLEALEALVSSALRIGE